MKALLPPHLRYIGGHPMAGREKSGFSAADGDLFRDKWYLLCPHADTDVPALHLVRTLAESLGAKVDVMDWAQHDQCAAVISHVPHIAAAALVNLLDCYPDPQTSLKLAGGGFRDTTRIASSDSDMWADVCISNSTAILSSLQAYQGILAGLSAAVERGDRSAIRAFFASAKVHRDSLLEQLDISLPLSSKND
jgi:prephenate dehydrogenase